MLLWMLMFWKGDPDKRIWKNSIVNYNTCPVKKLIVENRSLSGRIVFCGPEEQAVYRDGRNSCDRVASTVFSLMNTQKHFLEPKIAPVEHGRPDATNECDTEKDGNLTCIQWRECECRHPTGGEKLYIEIRFFCTASKTRMSTTVSSSYSAKKWKWHSFFLHCILNDDAN